MYTKDQIVEMVQGYVNITEWFHLYSDQFAVKHIADMLDGIQEYLLYNKPNCKFVELCAEEKWERAISVADSINKEVLKNTTLFQTFVSVVGREIKINKILK